jgi:hypothetical protein
MYQLGIGDERLRQQIRELTVRIEQPAAAGIEPIRRQRHELSLRLGTIVFEDALKDSDHLSPELTCLRDAKMALQVHEVLLESAKVRCCFLNQNERCRFAIGSICLALLPIAGILFATLARPDESRHGANYSLTKPDAEDQPTRKPVREVFGSDAVVSATPNDESPPDHDIGTPAAIANFLTRPNSDKYLDRGFKNFRFGQTAATVEILAARDPISSFEGRQKFHYDDGHLIGYERSYERHSEDYIESLRELFGIAPKDNITEAMSTNSGFIPDMHGNNVRMASREESVLVRYYFPSSIAYVLPVWRASAQANIASASHHDRVLLNVFDRQWVNAYLARHVVDCRKLLGGIEQIVQEAQSTDLELTDLPPLPEANSIHTPPRGAAKLEQLRFMNSKQVAFVTIERVHNEQFKSTTGAVSIEIRPHLAPGVSNLLADFTFLLMEIDRCNSLAAQEQYPPRDGTIEISKGPNTHQKSYTWKTTTGWKVTVDPGDRVRLTLGAERNL